MTATDTAPLDDPDRTAAEVAWDIDPLLDGDDVDTWLDRADVIAERLEPARGSAATMDVDRLVEVMEALGELDEALGRAANWASLRFAVDSNDPANGATLQRVQERATATMQRLVFFDLEWAALDDDRVDEL